MQGGKKKKKKKNILTTMIMIIIVLSIYTKVVLQHDLNLVWAAYSI